MRRSNTSRISDRLDRINRALRSRVASGPEKEATASLTRGVNPIVEVVPSRVARGEDAGLQATD